MNEILQVIEFGQKLFHRRLLQLQQGDGFTVERYIRYLSMQYHLTRGVQRHFFLAASHPDMANRRGLRKFLVNFGIEEELHFKIAKLDLEELKREPLAVPIDVTLWWIYFDTVIAERPFLRLGATCILENIAMTSNKIIDQMFSSASYLNKKNTRFFTIHRHEGENAHGHQIIEALQNAELEPKHLADLKEGAELAILLYLRMVEWCMDESSADRSVILPKLEKEAA